MHWQLLIKQCMCRLTSNRSFTWSNGIPTRHVSRPVIDSRPHFDARKATGFNRWKPKTTKIKETRVALLPWWRSAHQDIRSNESVIEIKWFIYHCESLYEWYPRCTTRTSWNWKDQYTKIGSLQKNVLVIQRLNHRREECKVSKKMSDIHTSYSVHAHGARGWTL